MAELLDWETLHPDGRAKVFLNYEQEVSRGIIHTTAWHEKMVELGEWFLGWKAKQDRKALENYNRGFDR